MTSVALLPACLSRLVCDAALPLTNWYLCPPWPDQARFPAPSPESLRPTTLIIIALAQVRASLISEHHIVFEANFCHGLLVLPMRRNAREATSEVEFCRSRPWSVERVQSLLLTHDRVQSARGKLNPRHVLNCFFEVILEDCEQ